ncbi:MAG: ATP-binding protein, partial [Candidatus Eisenbacteria bacterium]
APVDLARVVRESIDLLRSSLPATLEMKLTLAADTPQVLSDEIELHQVIMNLATNASHAMPHGGTLSIETGAYTPDDVWRAKHARLGGMALARVVVRDQGTGMPPEVAERVFEPFFTTKPAGQGTGLGLSVVHGIVVEHGGVIELDTRPGQGTTFTITLPAVGDVMPAEPAAPAGRAEKTRVLVVEDEETLGKMEKRQLESLGYHVTLHTGSIAALEDFRSRPHDFDLLMTDNTMPRMTGLQLTQEVLRIRPELPVLMVSGLAERADGLDVNALGVRVMLRKPHTARELDEAIRTAMRQP